MVQVMSEKLKKTLIIVRNILLGIAVAACVLYLAFMVYLSISTSYRHARRSELYNDGPWSGEAVWISEDEGMYIVSQYDGQPYDSHLEATVYLLTDGEWVACSIRMSDGYYALEFYRKNSDIDEELFTAEADVKWGKRLVLTKFSDSAAEYLPEGTKKIVLTKYDYEDYIGHVPFPVTRF